MFWPSPESYPPQSINIKGAGGDFVVIVGNVAKGTSIEDIKVRSGNYPLLPAKLTRSHMQLTFDPFGEVVDVVVSLEGLM